MSVVSVRAFHRFPALIIILFAFAFELCETGGFGTTLSTLGFFIR